MRRLAFIALLLLAACNGPAGDAVLMDSHAPPSLSPRFFPPEGWAWGQVNGQRYGVAAPVGVVSHGDLLILPDADESAEAWFETARALTAKGWTVWALDRIAAGGSHRPQLGTDAIHAPDLAPDRAAVAAMLRKVIRQPITAVIGSGEGALAAASSGAPAIVIQALPAPHAEAPPNTAIRSLGLGFLRPGGAGWSRNRQDAFARGLTHDKRRGGVPQAWQIANPDLRTGDPSLGRQEAVRRARNGIDPKAIKGAMLMFGGDQAFCRAASNCRYETLPNAGPLLHLEADAARDAWLARLEAFVTEQKAKSDNNSPA